MTKEQLEAQLEILLSLRYISVTTIDQKGSLVSRSYVLYAEVTKKISKIRNEIIILNKTDKS